MAYLHGKFVWFEHVSTDLARAREFYGALFGWSSEPISTGGEPYPIICVGNVGIGGFRAAPAGIPSHWMSYLSVADVDATVRAGVAAGAKVLMPPTDFGGFGRGATLADPTGAVLSVWKGAQEDRADSETVVPGDWYWNECMTGEPERALAFYERVFGFGHDTMNFGADPYYVLTQDGRPRGGLMKSPDPNVPPGWLPYVSVADCDATAARAQALGAKLCAPAMDLPEVGRFAVFFDPLGAALGIIRGKFTA